MGSHKQPQLPGFACVLLSCLETLGVKSVCLRLWPHKLDVCLSLEFVSSCVSFCVTKRKLGFVRKETDAASVKYVSHLFSRHNSDTAENYSS